MKITAIFHCLIANMLIIACSSGELNKAENNEYDPTKFFVVDYVGILQNVETLKLSEIALNVDYIRLETSDKCLLHTYAKY